MLFVPLPLFATLFLALALGRFLRHRDMHVRAHQLFAGLIALYALQSLLSSLRWGYDIAGVATVMALLAPVLPALAYLAYRTLSGRQTGRQLWPLGIVVITWIAFAIMPSLADPLILVAYLGFGGLLLRLCWSGADQLTLPSINDAREILIAMGLTGLALVASGLTDVYVIYDFVTNDGRSAGLVLTFVQTGFILAIGLSAVFAKTAEINQTAQPGPQPQDATDQDEDILQRLEVLFGKEKLHLTEDLSLRRISRRLSVSDRQVSNAVNRIKRLSVSQFVNEFRVHEACERLQETDETVLEISLASGFATKSNFNREFSRVTGQTPSQWRAAYRTGSLR